MIDTIQTQQSIVEKGQWNRSTQFCISTLFAMAVALTSNNQVFWFRAGEQRDGMYGRLQQSHFYIRAVFTKLKLRWLLDTRV